MGFVRLRSLSPVACVLALGFTSAVPKTIDGGCANLYDGQVCTWATLSGNQVVEFGATVPIAAIASAPAEQEMVWPPQAAAVIPLPAEAASATGFKQLVINWESHGHPPALFAVPHFDFHFYTVDPAAVTAIDCSDLKEPSQLPAGYTLPDVTVPGIGELKGLCVPKMGMHAMKSSEVDQTTPFSASMIVGYYDAKPIFVEPMIARTKLLDAKTFTMQVPRLADAPMGVRWPSHFEATYDGAAKAYRFTFSGLGE